MLLNHKAIKKSISYILLSLIVISNISAATFASRTSFTDVAGGEYYAESAEFLAQKGILSGYTDGSFGADKTITRAEMAAIVCRALGKEFLAEGEIGTKIFDDVQKSHWAFGYVNVVNDLGIVSGDGDGAFRPEDCIKYEEAIKMVLCALEFNDALSENASDWSKPYIDRANEYGITQNLRGRKGLSITRGDVAVLLYNSLKNGENTKIFIGEPIELSSSEDVYALGRILEGNRQYVETNSPRFDIPDTHKTNNEKIKYLQNAAYRLTNDIELTLNPESGAGFFLGIGSKNNPFKGSFDGNGKSISITAPTDLQSNKHMIGIFGKTTDAKIKNINAYIKGDVIILAKNRAMCLGGIAGDTDTTCIENCSVYFEDTNFGAIYDPDETIPNRNLVGGIAGNSSRSVYKNCSVKMKNSTIIASAGDVTASTKYGVFSAGGIIGFSDPGSSNTSNFGRLGNRIYNCSFKSTNITQQDVIATYIKSGQEICSGGLVGTAFNNLLIKDCSVEITNGNIIAYKSGTDDTGHTFGAQAGGIIGRLEHTGEVTGCSVLGNSLNIIAKSPNNEIGAGGIVGQDVGAQQRDVASVSNCTFNGSGNSTILVETTYPSSTNGRASAGGILGCGYYRVENCTARGVTIKNIGEKNNNPYAGSIIGYFGGNYFRSTQKKYFTPRESGIYNCAAYDVLLDVSDNVSADEFKSR